MPPEGQPPAPQAPMPMQHPGLTPALPPEQDPSQQPMTPEHRQQLMQMLGDVKQSYGRWQAMKFAGQNKADAARQEQLKRVFKMLQARGVNLQDNKSVAAYLQTLRARNPKAAAVFEKSLDYLLGKNDETQPQQAPNASPAALQGAPENMGGPQAE